MRRTLALVAVLAAGAGCRSDGGIDRAGNAHDFAWATSCIVRQAETDAAATAHTVASVGPALQEEFTGRWRDMAYTTHLYLETHEARTYDERGRR